MSAETKQIILFVGIMFAVFAFLAITDKPVRLPTKYDIIIIKEPTRKELRAARQKVSAAINEMESKNRMERR